jgi:ATP-binding cassette subfamily B protein
MQLGLQAQQIMVPVDHVLLPEAQALPAIVVVRHADGSPHFVVAWRRHGRFVQVMDPATGRRWPTCRGFLDQLYVHTVPLPAAAWREWAGSAATRSLWRRRLAQLGVAEAAMTRLLETALQDVSWRALGILDAAIRMVATMAQAGGLRRGRQAARGLATLLERAANKTPDDTTTLPAPYWSVQPAPPGAAGEDQVYLRGAVLVRVCGWHPVAATRPADVTSAAAGAAGLSPALVAALDEPPSRPGRILWQFLGADGLLAPITLVTTLLLAAGGVAVESLLFRGLLDLGRDLGLAGQRLGAMGMLLLFVAVLLVLELLIDAGLLRCGRRLETRLRMAFLAKLPRLGDRYLRSRPTSDMAERCHSLYRIRLLPMVGGQLMRASCELVLTTAGIVWLDPASAPGAVLAAMLAVSLPLAAQPLLAERHLRVRTHGGALSRVYLDALLGLVPVRTHGAERAVRYEHGTLLDEWFRASLELQRALVAVEGVQFLIGFGLTAWLLLAHQAREGEAGVVLLLIYWALNLPALGQEIALLARQYPIHRSTTLRLLEPLGAPEETTENAAGDRQDTASQEDGARGVAITMERVSVRAAGRTILEHIDLDIAPGSHVAIVGASGAGKSSLVGTLLGWHRPATGHMRVDHVPLDGQGLERLRQVTVWVDPAVQLWNRSCLDNLRYATPSNGVLQLDEVITQADLRGVIERLPDGLQTPLGEGGALVSGGEGQRLRFGRALLRPGARLVILDEPFRGLDRAQRRELLCRACKRWRHLTLLCITHDIGDTLGFDRVLVIDAGRIVEDGVPAELADQPGSRYRALLAAADVVRTGLWCHGPWRRLRLEDGRLLEDMCQEGR